MLKSLWVRYQRMAYLDRSVSKGCDQDVSRCTVFLRLDESRTHFQVLSCGCWQNLVPCWSLARGHPSVPCHIGCSIGQLTTQAHQEAREGVVRRWKSQVFFHIILFVKHFCWNTIPLQRRKTLTKPH